MKVNYVLASAIALAVAGALSAPAYADDSSWEVRLRAVDLSPANKSDALPSGLGLGVPADAIHVNSKWLPDLDFEYFFTPNWSSELILTYPQSQTVTVTQSAAGPLTLGTFKHLPPILTVKYNFLPNSDFRPYVGVGINLTLISNVSLAVPLSTPIPLSLDSSSVGPAAQVGFDYKIADKWFFNADVKWAQIGSDVKVGGTKITTVHIDPVLFGVGIGYKF